MSVVLVIRQRLEQPDYPAMPRPDLVGITAFTSQANRAYDVAAHFRSLGVPVVMGGIHATMCLDEAVERVDSVVTREAERVWPQVLEDSRHGCLKRQRSLSGACQGGWRERLPLRYSIAFRISSSVTIAKVVA